MSKTTYQKLQPIQKLVVVNSRLRHGDMSKIAKKVGMSSTTVKSVIEGKSTNERVLNVAYNVTRNRKKNFHVIKDFQTSNKKNVLTTPMA
jgi:ABC-type sulfate transport system substrate-binding protein|tara:strand:+ start:941 stop:1210 length:270 start_codon:yes stop_codon:yes gene_type:complete